MAADDVNEIVSGSKVETLDCSVVEGLSVRAAPVPDSLVAGQPCEVGLSSVGLRP